MLESYYSIDIIRIADGFTVFHCEYEHDEYEKAERDYELIAEDLKEDEPLYYVELNELFVDVPSNRYYVCGCSGVPIGGQPEDGYTLSEAYDRISRELAELAEHGYEAKPDYFSVLKVEHVF